MFTIEKCKKPNLVSIVRCTLLVLLRLYSWNDLDEKDFIDGPELMMLVPQNGVKYADIKEGEKRPQEKYTDLKNRIGGSHYVEGSQ